MGEPSNYRSISPGGGSAEQFIALLDDLKALAESMDPSDVPLVTGSPKAVTYLQATRPNVVLEMVAMIEGLTGAAGMMEYLIACLVDMLGGEVIVGMPDTRSLPITCEMGPVEGGTRITSFVPPSELLAP